MTSRAAILAALDKKIARAQRDFDGSWKYGHGRRTVVQARLRALREARALISPKG